MFNFFGKKDFEEQIRLALDNGNPKGAEKLARKAFSDKSLEEHELAWIASVMYERGIGSAFDLLEVFANRYPSSLHLPRVYLADVLSRSSQFDQASDHARHYLRQAKESEAFPDLANKRILQEGVSRSFLLLTSAYTTLGARSYSLRILEHGLKYDLATEWKESINKEKVQIKKELLETGNINKNKLWETFFLNGAGANELYELCKKSGFHLMAKRVDLIESNFRFNPSFKVGIEEVFLLVLESKNKEYLLA